MSEVRKNGGKRIGMPCIVLDDKDKLVTIDGKSEFKSVYLAGNLLGVHVSELRRTAIGEKKSLWSPVLNKHVKAVYLETLNTSGKTYCKIKPDFDEIIFDDEEESKNIYETALKYYQKHVGEWVCSSCASGLRSNQNPGITRILKDKGYKFDKATKRNYGKRNVYCNECGCKRTFYKLLYTEPIHQDCKRLRITPEERERIIKVLGKRDAFTGHTISNNVDVDHMVPIIRLENGGVTKHVYEMTDDEIRKNFQILTSDHNQIKRSACEKCKQTGIRPAFFGINLFYEGNDVYTGTCVGCGYYNGYEWRKRCNHIINNQSGNESWFKRFKNKIKSFFF